MSDRRRQRHLDTRQEILEIAWEIARAEGLAAVSLSELGRRMHMRTPSLYTYFESKNAVYDAMFAEAATAHLEFVREWDLPSDPRTALKAIALAFFDWCVGDPTRYQLLFQRTIPGFEPSADSYAIAIEAFQLSVRYLAEWGCRYPRFVDMLTGILTGFTDQQISNDPGGTRWRDLLDEMMDAFYNLVSAIDPGRG